MEKKEFFNVLTEYNKQRRRFRKINIGDLVWDSNGWGDYHTAVVKSVNLDEGYVNVIDVTRDNKEYKYTVFDTEQEMIQKGFSKESLEKEHKEYAGIIKRVLEGKI